MFLLPHYRSGGIHMNKYLVSFLLILGVAFMVAPTLVGATSYTFVKTPYDQTTQFRRMLIFEKDNKTTLYYGAPHDISDPSNRWDIVKAYDNTDKNWYLSSDAQYYTVNRKLTTAELNNPSIVTDWSSSGYTYASWGYGEELQYLKWSNCTLKNFAGLVVYNPATGSMITNKPLMDVISYNFTGIQILAPLLYDTVVADRIKVVVNANIPFQSGKYVFGPPEGSLDEDIAELKKTFKDNLKVYVNGSSVTLEQVKIQDFKTAYIQVPAQKYTLQATFFIDVPRGEVDLKVSTKVLTGREIDWIFFTNNLYTSYQVTTHFTNGFTDTNNDGKDDTFGNTPDPYGDGTAGGGSGIGGNDGQPPDRLDYEDGIFGSISFGLDNLLYWVKYPFKLLGDSLGELVSYLEESYSWVNGFSTFVNRIFGFLPSEVVGLIIAGFVSSIVVGVIRLFRG